MPMKTGKYIKPGGEEVEVLEVDEVNKIVRTAAGWVGEPDYKDWVSDELPIEGYPEPGEIDLEEVVKPKRGRKKKSE